MPNFKFKKLVSCLFLWMLLFSQSVFSKNFFVIWNVGQGQWTSAISLNECLHFDLGGEHLPYRKAQSVCVSKKNKIFLSHWDLDHVSGIKIYSQSIPKICLFQRPLGYASPSKLKLISSLQLCPSLVEPLENKVNLIYQPTKVESQIQSPERPFSKKQSSNDLSQVFLFNSEFLIPGDSTNLQEKVWAKNERIRATKVLILGHHGSHTSSSLLLLNHLPHLKMSISSARHEKYGHPHAEIIKRMQKRKVSLLKTEDWGNIWIEF